MNKAIELWEMTKLFLQMYPDAEWGDAHTVLSDGNFDTDFIEGTITRLSNLTNPNVIKHTDNRNAHEWVGATLAFLQFVLTIPEEDRLFKNVETD